MKKSQLRNIIKEELKSLKEYETGTFPPGFYAIYMFTFDDYEPTGEYLELTREMGLEEIGKGIGERQWKMLKLILISNIHKL